jgi:hypothetical protein
MASKSEKKGQKKKERADKLKGRAAAAAKGQTSDVAAKRLGSIQIWIVASLFIAAAIFIIYAVS